MSMRRVCAWCGSIEADSTGVNIEGEMAGTQSEITHCMCATCVHEWKGCAASALKVRRQRTAQIARRHEAPSPLGLEAAASGLESNTVGSRNGKVT
jgi:hypothetical protein